MEEIADHARVFPHRQLVCLFSPSLSYCLRKLVLITEVDYYVTNNGRSSLSAVWCVYIALDVDVIINLVHMLRFGVWMNGWALNVKRGTNQFYSKYLC